jgi:hypothetical protein
MKVFFNYFNHLKQDLNYYLKMGFVNEPGSGLSCDELLEISDGVVFVALDADLLPESIVDSDFDHAGSKLKYYIYKSDYDIWYKKFRSCWKQIEIFFNCWQIKYFDHATNKFKYS